MTTVALTNPGSGAFVVDLAPGWYQVRISWDAYYAHSSIFVSQENHHFDLVVGSPY